MKNGITLLGEPGKFTLKYVEKKLGTAVEQNGVFVLNFIPERTTADSDNILLLGPWEHRDDIDYTDDTVFLLEPLVVTLAPPSLRGVPPPPSCPLLLLLLRPTLVVSIRSELRLPLAGDAAPAGARGARALVGLAGAVEVVVVAVEGVGVVVGVVAGVEVSAAAVEAKEAVAVAEGAEEAEVAEAAEVADAAEAAVELVAALRRGVAPVAVSASSSSAVVRPRPPSSFVSGTLGGPAPSGVSQVDAVEPVEVAVDSGAARGAEPMGAGSGGAESGGAEPRGAESGGAEPGGAEPGGAESGGAEPGGAESGGADRAAGAGSPPVAPGPGGARTGGTGAAGTGGAAAAARVGPAGASGAAGAGVTGGVGAGVGAAGASGAAGGVGAGVCAAGASGAAGAGAAGGVGAGVSPGGGAAGAAGGTGAAGPVGAEGAGGTGAVPVGSGGPARLRPYFVPLLEQVLGLPPSPGPAPPLECPQPIHSQSQLQPVSPLPAPSPYAGPTGGLAERREPASRPASPVRTTRTSRRAPRPCPPAVPGTHHMALHPFTAPLRVPLPSPPESSLPVLADPESDSLRAASPTVARLLSTVVTDPFFESTAASALVAELVDFAARCRLDYATCLVAESESVCPPSVGGECALSTDVLEDRQEEFQCFAAALPHLVCCHPDRRASLSLRPSRSCPSLLRPPLPLPSLPSDESVEPSGPYPELVGCLMYLMTCTRPDLAYPLSILARYVAPGRHRPKHMAAANRVLRYVCSTSGLGLVLGGRRPVVLTGHADASWADDQATQRSSQGYTFSLGSGSVSWRSTRSSSVLGSSCEAEIYAGAMAAQELRWLTYLLTDLGEPPRSPPVLYVDNKAMLALCREHRPEHRTKHIALCYFLARELQQRGQLRLAYVASEANTADIFTKALPPGDHQRFCTMLDCVVFLLGADEPDEPIWGETPAERDARLLTEAEQRVAEMEILDLGRLVGVEPVPAASDQESGELVLAPGEYVDVEVRVPPPNLTRYVAPAFDTIRSDDHQLLLSFFANAEYYLHAQGHKATGETWHKRLGHPSQSTLNNTIKAEVLDKNSLLLPSGLELKPVNRPAPCTICPAENLPHEPFPTHFPGADDYQLMDKVYSDILNLPADGFHGECYYRPPTAPLGKFDQRAKWGLHLGIEKQYFAWRIMDYRSRLLVPSRDCIFYENLTLPVFEQYLAMQQNPATLFHGVRSFANVDAELAASKEHDSDDAREAAPDPPVPVTSLAAPCCCLPCSLRCPASACPACCAAMASLRVLAFDHEGRPIHIDTWLYNLQLYLLSDSRDRVSLFDHMSGAAPAPPTTADSATHSQWLTRDAAARLAIRNHLPLAECAHFGQHRTAQALYNAVVTRYSSPASAALSRLLLPYLFPELSAFATVEDLHLLAAETSIVAVGAARGTPRTPFFEGCSTDPLPPPPPLLLLLTSLVLRTSGLLLLVGSAAAARARVAGVGAVAVGVVVGAKVEVVAAEEVVAVVGVVAGVGALVVVMVAAVGVAVVEAVGVVDVGLELLSVEVQAVARGSSSSVGARPNRLSSFTCGKPHTQHRCFSCLDDAWRADFVLRVTLTCVCCPTQAAAQGPSESALPSIAPAEALHTFTLDSGASRCFFRDSTTLTPLLAPIPVRLADPSVGPVLARSSTVLPCPRVPCGSLSGLHLPSFSTNLVSTAALQDAMVTTTTPGGQRVSIYTCTRTGHHLAMFTRWPGSSLNTLATEPPQVASSAQVSASSPVAAPCSCRILSHQTLLWHHRPGHPSLPRLRGMHSCLLRAAPHSSSFPPTAAPLHTLHMDVWGPARVSGRDRERYFLLVVVDYTRYTTAFPLCNKGEVPDVLIPWIRAVRLQLRERFREDLPTLHLHSDRVREFSSDLLPDICRGEVRYAAHQLNLWPRVSLPETSPTLRWTRKVGDVSVFWVWGSRAFVREPSMDKLSSRAIPYVFLGFPLDAPGWQFYHSTSRHVFSSQDVTFDKSVPFYHLFTYRTAPLPPPPRSPLFVAPGPPPVAVDSGAARGTATRGAASGGAASGGAAPGGAELASAEPGGAEPEGVEPGGARSGGAEPAGAEPWGTEPEGAESRGAKPRGTASAGGPAGSASRGNGAGGAGATSPGGAGVLVGAGAAGAGGDGGAGCGDPGTGGTGGGGTGAGGARTSGARAPGAGGVGGAGAGDLGAGATAAGGAGAGGAGAGVAGAGDPRTGGTGAGGAGAGRAGAGGTSAGGAGAGGAGAGGT
ncbi:unnamed protein product [Closterium sp. NIES-54]